MRARIVLVACVFLFTPLFLTHAAEPPKPVHEGENDQCLVEKVSVKEGKVATETGSKDAPEYKQCKEANAGGGCTEALEKAGQCKCGTVTYTVTLDGKPCTVSKCDSQYKEKVKKCAGGSNLTAQDLAMRELTSEAININTPNDRLQGILEAFGESEAEAKAAVTDNKAGVVDFLQKAAAGDTVGAQAAARNLGLNPNLYSDVATLSPTERLQKFSPAFTEPQKQLGQQILTGLSTFGGSITPPSGGALPGGRFGEMFKKWEDQYGLPSGYLAGLAKVESSGNPVVCASQSSACGLFQYTSGTWKIDSARINGGVPLPLSARFDPEISARVTAASVAYYKQQYGSLIYGSGMNEKAAFYSLHNLGESGGQRFMRAFMANPSAPVYSVLTPVEIRNNPGLYGNGSISLAQAQANMLAKMSGSTAFTGSVPGGGQPGYSPFANVSPFVSGPSGLSAPVGTSLQNLFRGSGSAPRPTSSGGAPSTPTQPIQQPMQGGTPTAPGQGGTGGTAPTSPAQQLEDALKPTGETPQTLQPVQAVATIIAQPSGITRGKAIIVSWSTVGMSTNVPCTVTLQSGTTTSVVGQGNEGTRSIETSTTSASGAWDFVLKCIAAANGSVVERTTSVPVQ